MRSYFQFAAALFTSIGLCVLPAAADPTLSGSVVVHFIFVDVEDGPDYWAFNTISGSTSLTSPPVLDISIKPSMLGPGTLNWSDEDIWTEIPLDTSGLSVTQSGSGSYSYAVGANFGVLDQYGLGPTEGVTTFESVEFSNIRGSGEVATWSGAVDSNVVTPEFNVTLPAGAHLNIDQADVYLHNLTVNSGASLANDFGIVRHALTNHGSGNFAGTVEGNFFNTAEVAHGNVANVGVFGGWYLSVEGQLVNTGELNIQSRLEVQAASSNAGLLRIPEGPTQVGQFLPRAAFINNGTIELAGGTLYGPGVVTNNETFDWSGGFISDLNPANPAHVVNAASGSFVITGAGQMGLFGTLTNAGTITQSGGGDLFIGDGHSLINQAGALYDMVDDSVVSSGVGGNSINNAGTFRKSGGSGTSSIGVPFTNTGTIAVESGTLLFATESLTLPSTSTLEFLLSGDAPAVGFGKIDVDSNAEGQVGTLTVDGTLRVTLAPGYAPSEGDSYDLLNWVTRSGTFDVFALPALGSGLVWNLSQLYSDGVLSVIEGIAGDYNRDGVVDAADYVLWRKTLNSSTELAADGNNNGHVGGGDYFVWQAHFGEALGEGSGAAGALPSQTAVPEPATLVLLMFVAAGRCLRRGPAHRKYQHMNE